MKDFVTSGHDAVYWCLLALFICLTGFSLGTCDAKAVDTFATHPVIEGSWDISNEDVKLFRVCRYLNDNGWVSDNVDEETFTWEVSTIIQESDIFDNVRPALALAMAAQESRFRPDAGFGGAMGVFQLIPAYHKDRLMTYMANDTPYDKSLFYEPYPNIMAGMDYIDYILGECDGNEQQALMWYNEGPSGYDRYENGAVSSYAKIITTLAKELDNILS